MLPLLALAACTFSASTTVTDRYGDTARADTGDTAETGDPAVDTSGESGGDPVDTAPADDDGDGYRPEDGDCDDADPTTHPGASDGCNGIDNDCDGQIDEDSADAWEPNDTTGYDLGSLEDDPARSVVGVFTTDADVERFRFTIVDDFADFFTVTATLSGLPDGMTAAFAIDRIRSDGDEPLGTVTSTTGSGTLTLSFSDDVLSEDGGDYEVVFSSLGGSDCARSWLLGIAQ